MGGVAAIAKVAVPVLGSVLGSALAPKPPSPPEFATSDTIDPKQVRADEEQRLRDLRRRRRQTTSLLNLEESRTTTKSLLGE